MTNEKPYLTVLNYDLAIAQLRPDEPIPHWTTFAEFYAVVRTTDELSIVCETAIVPRSVKCEPAWRAIKMIGPLDFSLTGVLSDLLKPLADAGISVFAISTFDTDYVLVKSRSLKNAVGVLVNAGYDFVYAVEDWRPID